MPFQVNDIDTIKIKKYIPTNDFNYIKSVNLVDKQSLFNNDSQSLASDITKSVTIKKE